MRSFRTRKTWVASLAILGLAAIAVLASGLRGVSFRAGQIMAEREAQTVSLPVTRLVKELTQVPLWKYLLAWGMVFLIVLVASSILSPELRRRVVRTFLRFMFFLAALYILARYFRPLFNDFLLNSAAGAASADTSGSVPPPVFEPPQLSSALLFLTSLGVAILLGAIVWAIQRWWRRRLAFFASQRPREDLAGIARESLEKLSAGNAWEDVILESYVRMSQVVAQRRGLFRHAAMTPSEFAARLEQAGLPGHAVRTLTRLFEKVRYGARGSTSDEVSEAVTCLSAILRYCGETS